MILCNVKTSEVASGSVFKSGMTAIVSVYGVAWMADTYFGAYLPVMKKSLSDIVLTYPWMYAIVLFLVSKLINSQAAAVDRHRTDGINSVGVDPLVIVGFMPQAYGYFVLPTYPSDLACIGFDRSEQHISVNLSSITAPGAGAYWRRQCLLCRVYARTYGILI